MVTRTARKRTLLHRNGHPALRWNRTDSDADRDRRTWHHCLRDHDVDLEQAGNGISRRAGVLHLGILSADGDLHRLHGSL